MREVLAREQWPTLRLRRETFFAKPDGYRPVFWRSIGMIETAVFAGLEEIRTTHSVKAAADTFSQGLTNGGAR